MQAVQPGGETMTRASLRATLAAFAAILAIGADATPAGADFGLSEFKVSFRNADGSYARQAGAHPFKMTTFLKVNYSEVAPGTFKPDGGDIKDLIVEQMKGFVGSATAVPRCSAVDFANKACEDATAVGATAALLKSPFEAVPAAVFNLVPPPGVPARLGFITADVPLVIDVGVKSSPDYNVVGSVTNIPQPLTVFGSVLELWGVPGDPAHDFARGEDCLQLAIPGGDPANVVKDGELNLEHESGDPLCPANTSVQAFLTLPRACEGPLSTRYELDAWNNPGVWVRGSALTQDDVGPAGFVGCGKLGFSPAVSSLATTNAAESATGLDFDLSFNDPGLTNPGGIAQSDMKKAVVRLPEGVTVNPSIGEGLGVCTVQDLANETLVAAPGEGCPNESKIGTVTVDTPLLDRSIGGSVFLAQQDDPATSAPGAENPFDSLIAIYIVLKEPGLGILVKQAGRVEPDSRTGQLVSTFDDIPQVPFSHLNFHFREGQRAPLVTPPTCGSHTTTVELTPRARPDEVLIKTASFEIAEGPNGAACPSGAPLFNPGFEAGSLNNNAGSFSPFLLSVTRADGNQGITKLSAILPPGVVGKLAGVGKCANAQIAAAKQRTGREERGSPSCPSSSRIGRTVAGAGVGSSLTYVPGELYLAGPYRGAPLSVVSVTPALAGPFDAGTVVVRIALDLDPVTAQVEVDGASSDPIPHILKGIPLKLRDLRVFVDRRNFTLNPTSCDEESTKALIFGAFLDLFSAADDVAVARTSRYQAANCARLGFKPRLSLRLRGGTRRGDHPALRAVLRPRPGDANIESAVVRLPRSAFLDQGHIRTICTRVQFAADACPPGAVYGWVRAFTPLLDDPLEGPAYLRSSVNELPDLVFVLRGIVDIEASARIDSLRGAIRTTFRALPDAPISKVVVSMRSGRRGLIVNSRNLCSAQSRAAVRLGGHNGRARGVRPPLKARCGKRGSGKGPR